MATEVALVEKVDLHLALAESDDQLQRALAVYLAPVLLKLASTHAPTRAAVFKVIQNVFPRISAAPALQLPVDALLDQAKAPQVPAGTDASAVSLYSLLFVGRGVERLAADAQVALVPRVVAGISSSPPPVAARLFSILVKLLASWRAPASGTPEHDAMAHVLGFDVRPADEAFLGKLFAKFFLLQPNPGPAVVSSPGLSLDDAAFFTTTVGIAYKTTHELSDTKRRLLAFTQAGFLDASLVEMLLIASTDSLSAIGDAASKRFKKLTYNLENPDLIDSLVDLFTGSQTPPTLPVKVTLQERILALLCTSTRAADHPKKAQLSTIGLLSDYAKLRQTAVLYVRKVAKNSAASPDSGVEYNATIALKLKDGIMADGWPQIDPSQVSNYRTSTGLRELQYEALGDVLRHTPSLWNSNMQYLEFLFASLEGDSVDLRPTIQSVLSSLTVHLPMLADNCKTDLKKLLKGYLRSSKSDANFAACKYIAVKYVNCAYPFHDAEARYLCLLGFAKENNLETIEEARKGLHPYHFNLLQSANTLGFQSTMDFLGKNSSVSFPSYSDLMVTISDEVKSDRGNSVVKSSLAGAITFLLQTLTMQALDGKVSVVVEDEDWTQRVEKALEVDEDVRGLVAAEVKTLSISDTPMDGEDRQLNSFELFLRFTFDALCALYGGAGIARAVNLSSVFAFLITMSPPSIIEPLASIIPQMLKLITENTFQKIPLQQISESFGIILTQPMVSSQEVAKVLATLQSSASPSFMDTYIMVTAHIFAKMVLRERVEDIEVLQFDAFLNSLHDSVQNARHYDSSIEAISQLAIYGALGPSLSICDSVKGFAAKFREIVTVKAKTCHEESLLALSKLALSDDSTYTQNSELLPTEQVIFDAHVTKQIESLFSSGDAFLILAGGWKSKCLQQSMDIQGARINYVPMETGRVEPVLQSILQATQQSKPSLRKASCIWLLAMVQHLSLLPIIKEQAAQIHFAFMRFLTDRDELVQESAARGLSITYELGDADLKETLVKGLLKSFTDSNASSRLASGTVGLETQLFESDVLRTQDSSVSTYKDVLNLAADVGDPSLVYKFMSLAKSNALWSSRRGLAFGLGNILSKSSLDEMLAKNGNLSSRLIPKLFRYRFDPNQAVSLSMNDIWMALVKDTAKTVSSNFDLILKEIMRGMGSREWRTRQASTAALNNLLQSQPLERYEHQLEDVWNMSFRAMDDIKESVRKEGQTAARTLARILIRTADASTGNASVSKASQVMENLIPFFLSNKGILSDAEEIRNFALETLLKLCEIGGKSIRQHVPTLLSTFVSLMSTLEPEAINYLLLNADKYNINSNDVDARRLQSLGQSPMMDAVEKLMGLLSEEIMPETVRQLKASIKKSVGLPSKVCGSRVIVSLVTKNSPIARPHGDELLFICISQLRDRNPTVCQSYAAAAGYSCKIASLDAVIAYSGQISRMYLDAEDEAPRKLAALASESVSKYCGADRFDAVSSAFLPLAFVGKHDTDTDVAGVFEKEWIECSSGTSAIRHYFQEISKICADSIMSTNYTLRQTIAKTLSDVCQSVEMFLENEVESMFEMLLQACKGKSWDGKELVFDALVDLSVKCADYQKSHPAVMNAVVKTVITEQKRRNKAYQLQAVLSASKFLRLFPEQELVLSYIEIMETVLTDEYFEEADLLDEKSRNTSAAEELYLKYLSSVVTAACGEQVNSELLAFAFSAMKDFRVSDHQLTWKTCYSYNEFMKQILLCFQSTKVEDGQLQILASGLPTITGFGLMYQLEKNAVIFARNCVAIQALFKLYNMLDKVEFVQQEARKLLANNNSSVAQNELEKACT